MSAESCCPPSLVLLDFKATYSLPSTCLHLKLVREQQTHLEKMSRQPCGKGSGCLEVLHLNRAYTGTVVVCIKGKTNVHIRYLFPSTVSIAKEKNEEAMLRDAVWYCSVGGGCSSWST